MFSQHLFVWLFVCQHDNFRTSKHRMTKLGGGCIVQTSRPNSKLGVIAPGGAHPQKCGVGLRRWENQRRVSSCCNILCYMKSAVSSVVSDIVNILCLYIMCCFYISAIDKPPLLEAFCFWVCPSVCESVNTISQIQVKRISPSFGRRCIWVHRCAG